MSRATSSASSVPASFVPLYRKGGASLQPMTRLTPEVEIDGEACLLMTPQLAGVALRELGAPVSTLL